MRVVVVIPARGGSKGIPRKNLRPLAGKPLIYYAIQAAKNAKAVNDVYVSTDDEEIALFAERFGAKVVMRPPLLADDIATLDPTIKDAVERIECIDGIYDLVLTVQPTSPLINPLDISNCVEIFASNKEVDTVISVVDDRHLCWSVDNGKAVPVYQHRVNRQELPSNYRETGAVIACRRNVLRNGSRIGKNVELLEIPHLRSFDIDTYADFYLCESMLLRRRLVFVVIGYPEVGLGHVYRTLMLANQLVRFDITFVCLPGSELAAKQISSNNYRVVVSEEDVLNTVVSLEPDIVINDILDTDLEYVSSLKSYGAKVVNFEDLGAGATAADIVFNALYEGGPVGGNVCSGKEYFCLRDEFIYVDSLYGKQPNQISKILLTFGGVDEGDLTCRVLYAIDDFCFSRGIELSVVLGPGYGHLDKVKSLIEEVRSKVELIESTTKISKYMTRADLAVTSGGRTVFELAALHVPMVVICQNQRELTHTFASEENGIVNLGYREQIADEDIVEAVQRYCVDADFYGKMKLRLSDLDLRSGKARVCGMIENLL